MPDLLTESALTLLCRLHDSTTRMEGRPWTHNGDGWIWLEERNNNPDVADLLIASTNPSGHESDLSGEEDCAANAAWIAAIHTAFPALVAALEERDNLIHDLQQDSNAYHLGRASAFREVLDALREYRGKQIAEDRAPGRVPEKSELLGRIQASHQLIDAVLTLASLHPGERPPALPPDEVRARAARIEEALRKIIGLDDTDLAFEHATQIARAALDRDKS